MENHLSSISVLNITRYYGHDFELDPDQLDALVSVNVFTTVFTVLFALVVVVVVGTGLLAERNDIAADVETKR